MSMEQHTTELYTIVQGYTGEGADVVRAYWEHHPWIVEVPAEIEPKVIPWLRENMAFLWIDGGVTVDGYTWYGFDSEPNMRAFEKFLSGCPGNQS